MLSLDRQEYWREAYRAAHPGWRPATEVYAAEIRAQIGADTRLLDLGCGRGGVIEQLGHDPARITGIDPDLASLREHRLTGLPRAAGASEQLPFVDDSFDLVIAGWLLEHLGNPAQTFSEVSRVLRPGGAFVFITPNARHPLAWANRLFGHAGRLQGILVAGLYGRAESDTFKTAYAANSAAALDRLFQPTGLSLVRLTAIADPSYLAFKPWMFRLASALDAALPPDRHVHLVGVARKVG